MLLTLNHTAATRGGGIGERRVGLPRRDGKALFLLALERGRLDGKRRGAAGAVLCGAGESHRVFVVGDETDDLELVLCCWRVTVAGRVGKRGDFRCIASLFATGDLVGNGHGVCCRKALAQLCPIIVRSLTNAP